MTKKVSLGKIGLGIDHLWIVGILACFGLVISLMPLLPNDFWWHLKVGEIVYQTGRIPNTNLFSWSLPANYPYTYGAWLAGYLFYGIYHLGGIALILFTRNALTLVAFTLIGIEVWRRTSSWRIAGIMTMVAGAMSSTNVVTRPQNWAWIPFVIVYILLSRFADRCLKPGWLLVCPLLMMFWVNVHGSYVLGIALAGIFVIGETFRRLYKDPKAPSWKEIRWLGIIFFLTLCATLVNPSFTHIYDYATTIARDQTIQQLILEWQPPAPNTYAMVFFYLSILAMIGIFAFSRYRPSITKIIIIFTFLWLAWSSARNVIWFGMVAMPILGEAIWELVKDKPWMAVPAPNFLNLTLGVILWIPFILVQPWFISHLEMPAFFTKNLLTDSDVGPMIFKSTPIQAASYLKQHPGGNLFNEMGSGSYLIWANPNLKVFVDPRIELYPYQQWSDYLKITSGNQYNTLLDQYGADRLLLNTEDQAELIHLLEKDPMWMREYSDDNYQIWVKKK